MRASIEVEVKASNGELLVDVEVEVEVEVGLIKHPFFSNKDNNGFPGRCSLARICNDRNTIPYC